MKHIFSTLLLMGFVFCACLAQKKLPTTTTTPAETVSPKNPGTAVKSSDDRPRNFSLVFNRGLMLAGSSPDSVPLNSNASGTYFIGGGIKINLAKDIIRLRITPGIAWTHLNYDQTNLKTYPTVADSLPFQLTLEKQTLAFGELPIGIMFNATRDDDGDPRFFIEAGGYIGYLLAANYKVRYTNAEGQRIKEKRRDLEAIESEFERLRYGIYARAGYKWAAIYYSFRLSEVFDEFTHPSLRPIDSESYKNPIIPPMEIGISVFF